MKKLIRILIFLSFLALWANLVSAQNIEWTSFSTEKLQSQHSVTEDDYTAKTTNVIGTGLASSAVLSDFIVVDQFGYLPNSEKIAVIRNPMVGFDAPGNFTPGSNYALVDAATGLTVLSGTLQIWNSGLTDATSGDKAWHFDFSSLTTAGRYYVLDISNNLRSYEFEISSTIYNEVLKQTMRMFFYQRAGFAKEATYAGASWTDGASHIGPLQDKNCRVYNDAANAATELDLSGGWYDAGDFNKYTNWTANYIVDMMKAYMENPSVWGDNYNIPESGNTIPDLLDEAKWGIDFLLRMQRPNGSVLSIVGEDYASPPSAAHGQSKYGTASTSATLNAAGAFAIASKVYRSIGMTAYANTLLASAQSAWNWAVVNPAVLFYNNNATYGTAGLGAGQQETNDYMRSMAKLEAASFLYDVTANVTYRSFFDSNYTTSQLFTYTNFVSPYQTKDLDMLLYYTKITGATPATVTAINNAYNTGMTTKTDNLPAYTSKKDPYLAHLSIYTWGSNMVKANEGNNYMNMLQYNLNPSKNTDLKNAAQTYIHYLHGVNPLNKTYLSNMSAFKAENSVNEFYHAWFNNNTPWDRVGTSLYGPPPGYLVGGPEDGFKMNSCCETNSCGGGTVSCTSENMSPPVGQPTQKTYKDFNTGWPYQSWELTEPSCGSQMAYARLLSKFVSNSVYLPTIKNDILIDKVEVYPNPSSGNITVKLPDFSTKVDIEIINISGQSVKKETFRDSKSINLSINRPQGIYFLIINSNQKQEVVKLLIESKF